MSVKILAKNDKSLKSALKDTALFKDESLGARDLRTNPLYTSY